ncbi:MAG: VapC toxin family PIN domain ribonuclease [Micrococcales bacterium]|nr:VapC toxin family PIN domain ribonuclease [Micrococcales bacterium]
MITAILDTSALIDWQYWLRDDDDLSASSVSYAELEFGVSIPSLNPMERAFRQQRLRQLREHFGPGLPFDDAAAASYGMITQFVLESGRQVRGRTADLMIAAIAHANHVALITNDVHDLGSLEPLVQIIHPGARPN